ncbi:MAG: GAF domain-containing protein [Desulfobulbaceae bacterium]|nr:GAF domain-containing protein [Desulfobulbaceae bacterium]
MIFPIMDGICRTVKQSIQGKGKRAYFLPCWLHNGKMSKYYNVLRRREYMKTSILLVTADGKDTWEIQEALGNYEVVICRDASDADELCRRHDVYLVIVAEDLPRQSGCLLFSELRSNYPGLAGFLLSRSVNNTLLSNALDAGFSGLLKLPVVTEQLQVRVSRAMESVALQEENTRLRTLLPLYSLGEQFLSSQTQQQVLEVLLDVVVEQTGATHVSVMLFYEDEACLRIAAARGMDQELAQSIRLKPGDQIAGWVYEKGKPVILNRETQKQSIFASLLKRPEIISSISFPLVIRDRILGVLNISQVDGEACFSEADNEMLGIVCSQVALALENVRSRVALQEKTRLRTLFEQYVSPEVAGLLIASDSNLMNLGEVKDVTVLFADIRNFTGLVQHLELPDIRTFLNEFFQLFTETVFHNRGTVDKFMGDAVLAVFGAPVELENANLTAVRTALTIQEKFGRLQARWADYSEDFRTIDLGIAVTYGTVFLGNVGSAQRLDYTVIGNQVNIAQRLAAESSSCRIFITEPVRAAICDQIDVEEVGERALRGVKEKIPVFSIKMQKDRKNNS